jgi:hypothetical protein
MSRVTSVIGNSSSWPETLRSFSGSFRLARGYSRCSGCTPTACVGTRMNRRGSSGLKSGLQQSTGLGPAGPGPVDRAVASDGVSVVLEGSGFSVGARVVALIFPQRCGSESMCVLGQPSVRRFPQRLERVAKMPSSPQSVNPPKFVCVSYFETVVIVLAPRVSRSSRIAQLDQSCAFPDIS